MIKLNLEMLLLKLIRSATLPKLATDGDRHYDELTTTIIDILTNHVYGHITVAQIGKMLGFSRTYISAVFKANCGKTVMAYLNELKMSEAKYLIRKGQYSVSQVSDFLCYDNPQYFCRVFKKTVGLTPRQYSESVSYPDKYAKRP